MKTSQKFRELKPQALRGMPVPPQDGLSVTKRGRVKECPPALRRIIELANLPGDEVLLDFGFHSFGSGIPDLIPDTVRGELLKVWANPKAWEMTPQKWIDGWQYAKPTLEHATAYLRDAATADHYALIRGSRAALIAVTSGAEVFPVTTFLKRVGSGKNARATYGGDPISDALFEAELFYIRRCEVCRKFFYAQRENQETCPPDKPGKASLCAGKRRARKKRENDKLKQRLKRKRA